MTRVSCQKIWGSIPGSPKWSDDSWRLCICKVPTPAPSPREGRTNWGQSMYGFIFLTSHIQQQRLFASKGGENEQRAIHVWFYIPYFTYSTTTPFCFQGRGERTEDNPRRILYSLLHIFNKQRLLFPREERTNWKQFMRAFTLFTSHSQQTTLPVSKGGESELRAFHVSHHILYFSYSTNNASCFQGKRSYFVSIDMVKWMD